MLNRTFALFADEILREGTIIIKDKGIFMNFLCIITDEVEYVRESLWGIYKERLFVEKGGEQ